MKETDFKAFDKSELVQYAKEVSERWGTTAAYAEYQQKAKGRTDKEQEDLGSQLLMQFAELGKLKAYAPEEPAVQERIAAIQQFITDHYFQSNIDKAGGEGTAAFASRAIEVYCKKA